MHFLFSVKAKNEAEEYIKEMFKGDAKELDIKSLYKTGFQTKSPSPSTSPGREASPKKKSPPRKVPPQQKRFEGVPELVRSSSDDSGGKDNFVAAKGRCLSNIYLGIQAKKKDL